jgi:hypothetical protein
MRKQWQDRDQSCHFLFLNYLFSPKKSHVSYIYFTGFRIILYIQNLLTCKECAELYIHDTYTPSRHGTQTRWQLYCLNLQFCFIVIAYIRFTSSVIAQVTTWLRLATVSIPGSNYKISHSTSCEYRSIPQDILLMPYTYILTYTHTVLVAWVCCHSIRNWTGAGYTRVVPEVPDLTYRWRL